MVFGILGLIFLTENVKAQWNTGGEIENRLINFGFILGGNANTFNVVKKRDFQYYTIQSAGQGGTVTSGRLKYINSTFSAGFHLGLLANLKISDNLDFMFVPDVNFSDKTLAFAYDSLSSISGIVLSNPIIKTVQSTYLDLPLLMKFKSDRKGNIRSYIIAGLQYSYDIIPKKKSDDAGFDAVDKLVKIQNSSISYKIGIGLDLYYEYFKMSPEISVTNGLNNILNQDNNPFSSPIQKLIPTSIQFSLYFE
jgi:hypothetical protein